MSALLSEMRIAIGMLLLAVAVPLAWSYVDVHRRLALKQAAFATCSAHTKHLERCMHLHPGELAPGSYELCRSGGNSHAACSAFNPNWRGKP